ncbi:hypothetical protein [Marivirga sp.]|uniref:hypothetical protein n=1 Tax=Marivirga sp. TaxID=2018662 RepID=UPI003DA76518
MNPNSFLIFLLVALLSACDVCRDPQSLGSYQLTEDEISLIPYTDYNDLRYENEEGNIVVGSTQPKIIEDLSNTEESCTSVEYQKVSSFLSFRSVDIAVQMKVEKYEKANFILTHYFPDHQESIGMGSGSDGIETTSDFSYLGFDFKDVIVFETSNEASEMKLIVYSVKNGVELIAYRNGDYLKLVL